MDIEALFDHPDRRRWWLLAKALESAPLDEALKLVLAVEDLLNGPPPQQLPSKGLIRQPEPVASAAAASTNGTAETAMPVVNRGTVAPQTDDVVVAGTVSAAKSEPVQDTQPPPAVVGTVDIRSPASPDPCFEGLVVMATADDVVRYLRRRDDVVVPDGNGEFLVNGRFQTNLEELVERANRMRRRQKLPVFVLVARNLAAAVCMDFNG